MHYYNGDYMIYIKMWMNVPLTMEDVLRYALTPTELLNVHVVQGTLWQLII